MRPVPLILAVLVLVLAISGQGFASELRVLVTEFPPFTDSQADDGGLAWSELTAFVAGKGVTVVPVFTPTARILSQVRNENWQASLVSIPLSTNVADIRYSESAVSYGVFTDDPAITSLSNLRVATIRTNSRSNFQVRLIEADAVVVEVDSLAQGYRMIDAGRVDGVLGVGVDGVAIGAREPEKRHMLVQLAVLPFTLYLNTDTPQGREALRLLGG